ncbi:MAG: exonuclease SbcC [Porticoccaceae bacterium]|jgi:exonuclease SbcC
MAMMSQLLDKMKPKTLEQRLAELPTLSMEALTLIIEGDDPESLRIAAVAHLVDSPVLTALAVANDSLKLQQAAKIRIASLIDDSSIVVDEFSRRDMDSLVQLSIVGFCEKPDFLTEVLSTHTDEAFLYQIAIEGVPARLRELAAAKIEDANQLKQLLKDTRGKDKLVYKIVKDKCDQLRDQEKQAEQIQADIGDLCERLEAHSKRPFDKQFVGRATRMIAAWADLESASSEPLKSQSQLAIALCQQTIETHELELATVAATKATNEAAEASINGVVDQLHRLLSQLYASDGNAEEVAGIALAHQHQVEQWNQAKAIVAVNNSAMKTFTLANEGMKLQMQLFNEQGSLQTQLTLLASIPTDAETDEKAQVAFKSLKARLQTANILPSNIVPTLVLDARKILAKNDQYWADKKKVDIDRQRHINALISQANQALQKGLSRDAAGIRRTLERKLGALEKLPTAITAKVEQLDEALSKLLDWKNFAVEPKQQELIDQMQVLTESQDNPEALASKIRRLQDQWKSLSKDSQDQQLWEVFHKLAEQAYQPCKVYYDQKSEIRRSNIEKRRTLVSQLNDYVTAQPWEGNGAESIDWKLAEKLIGTAIREWQSYAPTDRDANKPVQKKFDRLLDSLRSKLSAHQQQNAERKQLLIAQVDALLENSDKRAATEKVKQLQAQWQKVGVVPRKQEQKLWRLFRASCDAVFAQRHQQSVEFKAELNTHKGVAEELIKEVLTLGALSGKALLDGRTRVTECKREFSAVGNLPKAAVASISQRFQSAVTAFDTAITNQIAQAKLQLWDNLFTASAMLGLAQTTSDESASDALLTKAQDFMASVEQWPKNGYQALEKKMARGSALDRTEDYQKALQLLCIRAEILADQETPPEDKALRMQYQVSRLQQGFGQNSSPNGVSIQDLVIEWIAAGAVANDIYEPLLERFNHCR